MGKRQRHPHVGTTGYLDINKAKLCNKQPSRNIFTAKQTFHVQLQQYAASNLNDFFTRQLVQHRSSSSLSLHAPSIIVDGHIDRRHELLPHVCGLSHTYLCVGKGEQAAVGNRSIILDEF